MFRILNLLLLFFFINNIGTVNKPVRGIKGGNVTLSCEIQDGEKFEIDLSSQTEKIVVCETEECSGRVIKEGSCDVIIKNLTFSDAGDYILDVRIENDNEPLKRLSYQLHIQDEISVETGDELKLDVLFAKADKVETNSSGEWERVWTRDKGHEVIGNRLTISNESLIIKSVKDIDAGTYRVLDYNNALLITVTVTVTESRTESNEISSHKTNGTETPAERNWILPDAVSSQFVLVIVALIVFVFAVKKCQRRLVDVEKMFPSARFHRKNLQNPNNPNNGFWFSFQSR